MFSRFMLTAAATAGLALPAMADTRAVQAQAIPHAHGTATAQVAPTHVKPGATAAAPATPATPATPSANAGKQAGAATPAVPGVTPAVPAAKAPAVAATPAAPGAARTN